LTIELIGSVQGSAMSLNIERFELAKMSVHRRARWPRAHAPVRNGKPNRLTKLVRHL
jgi:hypothetical protein